MSADDDAFLMSLLGKLAQAGLEYSKPKIPSRTLQGSIFTHVDSPVQAYIEIPQYWAEYLHDGRGQINAAAGSVLIYFRNKNDDPRLRGGISPERLADQRPLSKAQFLFWLAKNRQAHKAGIPAPMIIKKRVGPMAGSFFFDNDRGMAGFDEVANNLATPQVTEFLNRKVSQFSRTTVDRARGNIGS